MQEKSAKELYSLLEKVWPENNRWYDYTKKSISKFIYKNLSTILNKDSIYLNAGSGGSNYELLGTCYHVDIASNLIKNFQHSYVCSIEKLPFCDNFFDAIICVGSVINYCDPYPSIIELARTLKPGGLLIIEFERSNTAELFGKRGYGKAASMQRYNYLGQVHTLWLYSESHIKQLLLHNHMRIIRIQRFHICSALANRLTGNEEASGKFCKYDYLFKPISYVSAHNAILLCIKNCPT